jgi:hypothetical protein
MSVSQQRLSVPAADPRPAPAGAPGVPLVVSIREPELPAAAPSPAAASGPAGVLPKFTVDSFLELFELDDTVENAKLILDRLGPIQNNDFKEQLLLKVLKAIKTFPTESIDLQGHFFDILSTIGEELSNKILSAM